MFRSAQLVVSCVAAALSVSSTLARPIFMEYEGIKGSCTDGSSFQESFVGGNRVVEWHAATTGSGGLSGGKISWSDASGAHRPVDSFSLNFTKVQFDTAGIGSSHTVADDVIVDGRIITAALWARWSKGPNGEVRFDFGKSADAPGTMRIVVSSGGVPVAQNTCVGDIFGCWVLTALCPELECSIMCPELCGLAQWKLHRDVLVGGVAIDAQLGGPSTFNIPGYGTVTGDAISVVLVPQDRSEPMRLVSASTAVEGLAGLVIKKAAGELVCPADMDASGELTVADVFEYLNYFFAGDPAADYDDSGVTETADIFAFLRDFFAGCE